MKVPAVLASCAAATMALANGPPPVDPRFEPLLPLAAQCLSGPVPEAACVGLIEAQCLDGQGDTGNARTVCAQASAQIWQRAAHDTALALLDRLTPDGEAHPILTAYVSDMQAWRAEACDVERRLAEGADLEAQVTAACTARIARMQALRLHRLVEDLR